MGKKIMISLEEFLEFFDKKPRTNKDVCEKFEVSKEVARKHINKLLEEDILELIDDNRYRLVKEYQKQNEKKNKYKMKVKDLVKHWSENSKTVE